jgi:hypothetical protein
VLTKVSVRQDGLHVREVQESGLDVNPGVIRILHQARAQNMSLHSL